MTEMPGRSYSGSPQPLSREEMLLRDKLQRHVSVLAGEIGERNMWHYPALQAAAGYIRDELLEAGYEVKTQPFLDNDRTVSNIEAELAGKTSPDEIVIVGAHYDSVIGCPGANDNGSGVAAVLELARLLAKTRPARSLRFVAFVNEEPPFFYTEQMGSRVYATRTRQQGERITAMLSLETIGYYTQEPGSQRYPFPFRFFYPDTGNFVAFVGNLASRRLVRQSLAAFRAVSTFPSEGASVPGWITGVHWSDHWSFWKEGYPAIMITDTALFRYRHYHTASDTPERLDYDNMARVVGGLKHVIEELAGAP